MKGVECVCVCVCACVIHRGYDGAMQGQCVLGCICRATHCGLHTVKDWCNVSALYLCVNCVYVCISVCLPNILHNTKKNSFVYNNSFVGMFAELKKGHTPT